MFHKLHIKLTLFFTMGTGTHSDTHDGHLSVLAQTSLSRNNTMLFPLQSALPFHIWKRKMSSPIPGCSEQEHNNHFSIQILDNQHPLFFSKLEEDPPLAALYDQALTSHRKIIPSGTGFLLREKYFGPTCGISDGSRQKDYYASVALIPRDRGCSPSSYFVLPGSSKVPDSSLRLLFLAADLAGLLCLAVFSWYLTKKLLNPLEDNRRQQTQFIASASHELRTPLAVIRSCLSALRTCPAGESPHFYNIMEEESQRMTSLIQDMLSLANADNHTWSLNMTSTEMDTLLLNLFEHYENLAREKEHHLQILLPEEVCPACICDPERIIQVLSIFIDNALSYTPKGSTITLSLQKAQTQIQLSVADNGPGIPDEEKDAVFQRFYRSDQSRHSRGHYGLGLSIAWEIVHLHKGSLKIKDAPGGGAVFVLSLPLV